MKPKITPPHFMHLVKAVLHEETIHDLEIWPKNRPSGFHAICQTLGRPPKIKTKTLTLPHKIVDNDEIIEI